MRASIRRAMSFSGSIASARAASGVRLPVLAPGERTSGEARPRRWHCAGPGRRPAGRSPAPGRPGRRSAAGRPGAASRSSPRRLQERAPGRGHARGTTSAASHCRTSASSTDWPIAGRVVDHRLEQPLEHHARPTARAADPTAAMTSLPSTARSATASGAPERRCSAETRPELGQQVDIRPAWPLPMLSAWRSRSRSSMRSGPTRRRNRRTAAVGPLRARTGTCARG